MSIEETIRAAVLEAVADAFAKLPAPQPSPAALPRYLSTQEAADVAGVEPEAIRDWQDQGRLPRHKAGRLNRVRLDELEAFLRDDSPAKPRPPTEADLDRQAANIVQLRK